MLLHTLFYTFVHTPKKKKKKKKALKYNKHCSNQIINKLNNHLDHATWIPTLNKKFQKLCFF